MPGPYRDTIYTIIIKEQPYVFNQQTARGTARRSQHHGPVYQIGKGEIDETLKQGIADCIAARELIKIKVLENSEYDPREAADILCEALDCDCVQVIGRKFVLFKQKKKESAYAALLAK